VPPGISREFSQDIGAKGTALFPEVMEKTLRNLKTEKLDQNG
jgi:hypothetical protein